MRWSLSLSKEERTVVSGAPVQPVNWYRSGGRPQPSWLQYSTQS